MGKITAVNSWQLPMHLVCVILRGDRERSKQMFFKFIWDGKGDNIKRSILFNKYEHVLRAKDQCWTLWPSASRLRHAGYKTDISRSQKAQNENLFLRRRSGKSWRREV